MDLPQSDDLGSPHGQMGREIGRGLFRSHVEQVVTIHQAMFQRLLFGSDAMSLELGRLFEDAGRTYLEIARDFERHYGPPDSRLNNILKPES
jgi:hypothetical protein